MSPLGTARKQLFFFFLSPSLSQSQSAGAPRKPGAEKEAAGTHLQRRSEDPRGRFPDARRPAAALVQVLAASVCPPLVPQVHGLRRSEAAVWHLPFELLPHGCKGSAVEGRRERRSELPRGAGLPESRPPPPPRLAAESTAEEPARAGGRAGGRAGRGSCRQTGRGRARLRPHLATWEPGLRETPQRGAQPPEKGRKRRKQTEEGI